jgi:hypothetical protein
MIRETDEGELQTLIKVMIVIRLTKKAFLLNYF